MKRVKCPITNKLHWGNDTKNSDRDNMFRCTKCGQLHTGVK